MPYRMFLFAAAFQNGCRSRTALQFLSLAVERFKGSTVLCTYSQGKVWGSRSQHRLPTVREETAVSNRISVITLTPALAAYKQKLFYHIQAKGGAMFRNFILFAQPLLYLVLLQWTFKLFNSSLSVHMLCACE